MVLAGGRGVRMGGLDKGLALFNGVPLVLQVLQRLQPQVGQVMLNANRNLEQYRAFGVPVFTDAPPGYIGPLGGFVSALRQCSTPYLMAVACDVPFFPGDLVARLAQALAQDESELALPATLQPGAGPEAWRSEPVFCLMQADLLPSLEQFIAGGGRRVESWTTRHHASLVRISDRQAFANLNTPEELRALQAPAAATSR